MTLAVAIALMGERRLALTDTLAKWLPEFPGAGAITVGHLISHRAGIRHRVADPAAQGTHHTGADVAAGAGRFPLLFVVTI